MNFFEQQRQSRRDTGVLLFLFTWTVILVSVGVGFGVQQALKLQSEYWQKIAFGNMAFFTLITLWKWHSLWDGRSVAAQLGGESADPGDAREKQLLNIVEEISIAAHFPIPSVFVLRGDESINAFAAGDTPQQAAIAVTSGALKFLTRDELQGVVAHEFSHLIYRDVRLNQVLAGVVSGFLILQKLGARVSSRSARGKAGAALAVLFVAGLVGQFIARILKSCISQQREFLADASAAQFTRNPESLARVLAKIEKAIGSSVISPNKVGLAHLFFANPWANFEERSHPPIRERIQKLLPQANLEFFLSTVETPEILPPEEKSVWRGNVQQAKQFDSSDEARLGLAVLAFGGQANAGKLMELLREQKSESLKVIQKLESRSKDPSQKPQMFFQAVQVLQKCPVGERQEILSRLHESLHADQILTREESLMFLLAEQLLLPASMGRSFVPRSEALVRFQSLLSHWDHHEAQRLLPSLKRLGQRDLDRLCSAIESWPDLDQDFFRLYLGIAPRGFSRPESRQAA